MKQTAIEQFDQIPPCWCRLCARRSNRAMTLMDISNRSGLSLGKVHWISKQPTWANIKLEDAIIFAKACGVDLLRPRKKLFYLKRAWDLELKTLGNGMNQKYVQRQLAIRLDYDGDRATETVGGHDN